MCRIVVVDGEYCDTNGELTEELGGPPIYKHSVDMTPEDCLCNIDIPATAKHYGMTIGEDNGWETFLSKVVL